MQLFVCGPAVDVRGPVSTHRRSAAKDLAWSSAAKFNLTTKLLCECEVEQVPTDTSDGFQFCLAGHLAEISQLSIQAFSISFIMPQREGKKKQEQLAC